MDIESLAPILRKRVHGTSRPDACHLWSGPKKSGTHRYGKIKTGEKTPAGNPKYIGAHVVACWLAYGPPPEGKPFALHSCDNPRCCNPRHLRWGSSKDNSDDMTLRDRRAKTRKPTPVDSRIKIYPRQIETIMKLISQGVKQKEIAKMYDVSPGYISRLKNGYRRSQDGKVLVTSGADFPKLRNTKISALPRGENFPEIFVLEPSGEWKSLYQNERWTPDEMAIFIESFQVRER